MQGKKWIDWWIRIIQKYVSEAVVTGIEAGLTHRSRLAQDLIMSPHNSLTSPKAYTLHRDKSKPEEEKKARSNSSKRPVSCSQQGTPQKPPKEKRTDGTDHGTLSLYKQVHLSQIRENEQVLQTILAKSTPKANQKACGLHVIFHLMTYAANQEGAIPLEPQIERDSFYIRIWMVKIVTSGTTLGRTWCDSMI